MPFVRFAAPSFPAPSDPFVDMIAAALAAESAAAAAPKQKPAQCQRTANGRVCRPAASRPVKRVITPSFDISETEHEYILEGELPGVSDKSSISVDFDDAQTVVVKGEIMRQSRAQPQSQTQTPQLTEEALQASAANSEKGETVVYEPSTTSEKKRPHSVTVEEVVDESDTASNASFEVVDGPTKADKGKSPAREDVVMTEAAEKPAEPTPEKKTPSTKYWIAERAIGVFERKFWFKELIDQDNVRASLENGLLTIVVPKRQAYVRQVFIN